MKKLAIFIVVLIVAMGAVYALFKWNQWREESTQQAVVDVPVTLPEDRQSAEERKWKAVLFFPLGNLRYLHTEERSLTAPEKPRELASLLVEQLVKGPADGGYNTIPLGARLRGAFFEGRESIYLDFSQELRQEHIPSARAEALTVYSIVNTIVANIEGVKRVHLLVDGSEVDTLGGHLKLDQPLSARPDMVVAEDGAR